MASRARLRDRLFTLVTTLAAVVIFVVGMSRGNARLAVVGALFFLGYGVLHAVTRRLEPAARLLTGAEADHAEAVAQFRATRLAGQGALLAALLGLILEFTVQWGPGLWVAGTVLMILALFVGGLWFFARPAQA